MSTLNIYSICGLFKGCFTYVNIVFTVYARVYNVSNKNKMTQFLDCRLYLGIGDVCHTEHERESSGAAGARYFLIFFCLKSFFTPRLFSSILRREKRKEVMLNRPRREGKMVETRQTTAGYPN